LFDPKFTHFGRLKTKVDKIITHNRCDTFDLAFDMQTIVYKAIMLLVFKNLRVKINFNYSSLRTNYASRRSKEFIKRSIPSANE